ncbi:hypothetical protein [Pedobacter alpinus]|uniref:Lipoprotein n=1 Tax=Pedobacter alpinus TaxID=1590643 RepID=A0ABW5TQ94_9SPHI
MKLMVAIGFLCLSGCKLIKQKERVLKDSLFKSNTVQEIEAKQKAQLHTHIFWNDKIDHKIFIIADAPFRWHIDSGLSAGPGHYQVYSQKQQKGSLAKEQQSENTLSVQHQLYKKEEQRIKQLNKNVEKTNINGGYWWIALFILIIGILYAKKRFF